MSAAFAPIISSENKEKWEEYSVANQGWIETSHYLETVHQVHRDALHGTIQDHEHDRRLQAHSDTPGSPISNISEHIYRWENDSKVQETNKPGNHYAPMWQVSPADYSTINVNLLSDALVKETYDVMVLANHAVMSRATEIDHLVRPMNCTESEDFDIEF